MSEPSRLSHRTFDVAELGRQVVRGAAIGLGVGLLLIGVGVLRGAVALLGGGHISALSRDDALFAAFYLGGFTLAGAVIGAILPRLRTVIGLYSAFGVAGTIVAAAIVASDKGGLRAHDWIDWVLLMPISAMFGCAFAYGWSTRS